MTRRRVPRAALLFITGLVAVATGAALTVAAAPARAAAACSPDGKVCVSAISYSPGSVDNAVATPVTVTVQATAGFKNLGILLDADLVGVNGSTVYTLTPVSGSSGSYRGSFTAIRNAQPGSHGPSFLTATPFFGVGSPPSISGEQLAAAGLARLTVTGSADAAPPVLTGFTAGTGPYDAGRGGSVPVTVRVADAGSGVAIVQVSGLAIGSDDQAGTESGASGRYVRLTRTAGTAQDGTWTGSLPLVGGTSQAWSYDLNLIDVRGNSIIVTSEQLAARGLTSTFRTVTTGVVPAVPTGLRLTSTFDALSLRWVAVATWNPPAAGAVSASSWLVGSSGSCVQSQAGTARDARYIVSRSNGSGVCRVTVRARNAVGTSAASGSASAVLP